MDDYLKTNLTNEGFEKLFPFFDWQLAKNTNNPQNTSATRDGFQI